MRWLAESSTGLLTRQVPGFLQGQRVRRPVLRQTTAWKALCAAFRSVTAAKAECHRVTEILVAYTRVIFQLAMKQVTDLDKRCAAFLFF